MSKRAGSSMRNWSMQSYRKSLKLNLHCRLAAGPGRGLKGAVRRNWWN